MKIRFSLLIALITALSFTSSAQHQQGVGLHFGGYDFYGPITGKYFRSEHITVEYNDKRKAYDTARSHKTSFWRPMVKASYWYQASKHFDINMALSLASLEYPNGEKDTLYSEKYRIGGGDRREKLLGEFDLRFNYSILDRDKWCVSPYVFAGINGSYHDIFLGADIPMGVGLNIALNKMHTISLNLESAYKVAATSHDVNHLQHSVGVVYWFKPGFTPAKIDMSPITDIAAESPVKDMDNDGIEDAVDKCPTIPGMAQFDGCPDTDGDGIGDADDACPLVAGLAQFKGCPDTDNDGIPDNLDKCPYVAGAADRGGCPVPDRDGDGFPDDVDRCPDAYSKTNNGCPEVRSEVIMQVDKAAKAIFFESGKATIKTISYKSLDIVANILKADPSLFADIEGHTDNVKPKTYTNMDLSQRRADAVKQYIVGKGISNDRLTAQGFGETQPVSSNDSAPGRAQNRRTVIKVRNYTK